MPRKIHKRAGLAELLNFGVGLFALLPMISISFAGNQLIGDGLLERAVQNFYFGARATADFVAALYTFAIAVAGFALIGVCILALAFKILWDAGGPQPCRRALAWGLAALFSIVLTFVVSCPVHFLQTPDQMFSRAVEHRLDNTREESNDDSSAATDTLRSVELAFRKTVGLYVVIFTFAASASAACASPAKVHNIPAGGRSAFFRTQLNRHHLIFYGASAALLMMLLLTKARLEVHEAALIKVPAVLADFEHLRRGLEIYWGGILTLSLAAIYVPTLLILNHRLRRAVRRSRPDSMVSPIGARDIGTILWRAALILLPTLFSGGVGELIKSILEQ